MSSSTDFSAEQLTAARATAWHQDGKALVTLESARSWVDHYGFILFAPRAAQLGAPAPSFVETTLGAANDAPTAADSAIARGLVARLVAEGSVIPLNLLGSAGDVPDFLASAKIFPYIFTMRGDKAWKQPPQTSGAAKVSPLALRVFETLQEKGAMSASELASELGREVTETAIQRALSELWAQLRVIPQLQQDENAATLWELLSVRFSKAIKAGANAGQPSAMSALLSLYLTQAVAATEEEVAGFLSPLTARSRVREVVHALTAGRQLAATVVDGKTLLHVSGVLPEFAPVAKPEGEAAATDSVEGEPTTYAPKKVGTGRIGKFAGTGDKPRTDFKGKPARTFGGASSSEGRGPSRGPARKYGTGADRAYSPRPDTNRRPFTRKTDDAARPTFTKPWDEDKRPRSTEGGEGEAPAAPRERESFGAKPAFGAKKSFGGDRKPFGERKSLGGPKPFGDRKPYTPREGSAGGSDRPRRSFGDKPSFGARPSFGDRPARPRREDGSEGFTPRERPSYPPREGGPPRERKSFGGGAKPFGDRKPFGGAKSFGDRKTFAPRREGSSEGFTPRERPSYPRREGSAPPARSYERKPYTPREGSGGEDRPRRSLGDKPSFGGGAGKPGGGFSKFSKPGFSKPAGAGRSFDKPAYGGSDSKPRSSSPRPGGFGAKPGSGAGRPSFGDSKPRFGGGGKPAGSSFGSRPPSSRPPSKFGARPGAKPGPKPGGGGKFGAKPGRPFTKRPGGAGPTGRKPDAEE